MRLFGGKMSCIVQTRIDSKSKEEAEVILKKMGMSLSDGIRIFIHQVINDRALPFKPNAGYEPNEETVKVIEDAENGIGLSKPYNDMQELLKDLEIC